MESLDHRVRPQCGITGTSRPKGDSSLALLRHKVWIGFLNQLAGLVARDSPSVQGALSVAFPGPSLMRVEGTTANNFLTPRNERLACVVNADHDSKGILGSHIFSFGAILAREVRVGFLAGRPAVNVDATLGVYHGRHPPSVILVFDSTSIIRLL